MRKIRSGISLYYAGLIIFIGLVSLSFIPNQKITVYLVGDSTMSDKAVKAYPETGWGMPFHYFFDDQVKVDNRAKNGRSTKSFMTEGLWKDIYSHLNPGDYVFVQFGHNDEVITKKTYTTLQQFTDNLKLYVNQTREKKAFPVLITPVTRRNFDANGKIEETHPKYTDAVREVANELHVPLIDLDSSSKQLVGSFGPENSKLLYNQLEPGENPNYPKGVHDNTHFNELGARKMAELVLASIIQLKLPLANYIVHPVKK